MMILSLNGRHSRQKAHLYCPVHAPFHGELTMKILGINASPKGDKSQTRRLVMGVLEGARQSGADITFIDICSLDIAYCTACGTCYAKGECVTDDDYGMLLEKMMDADGIVLGSPNYINAVTAQLKTILDRMADVVHCQSLAGKYRMFRVHCRRPLCRRGRRVYEHGPVEFRGNHGRKSGSPCRDRTGRDCRRGEGGKGSGRKLADAIRTKWKDPVQEKHHEERREYFKRLISFNKDLWTHKYQVLERTRGTEVIPFFFFNQGNFSKPGPVRSGIEKKGYPVSYVPLLSWTSRKTNRSICS